MSRMSLWAQAGLLACTLATSPAMAQSAGADQGESPPPPAGQPQDRAHRQGGQFIERFRAANTTGDGRLTLAQAEAGHMPMIVRHFDAIDVQHKGYVTLDDVRAYQQQMRAAHEAGNRTTN